MKNIERVSVGFTKLDFRRKIFTYFINIQYISFCR